MLHLSHTGELSLAHRSNEFLHNLQLDNLIVRIVSTPTSAFLNGNNHFVATKRSTQHPTIDGVVDASYTTKTLSPKGGSLWLSFEKKAGATTWCTMCARREKSNNFTWRGLAKGRELRTMWFAGYHAITLSSIWTGPPCESR